MNSREFYIFRNDLKNYARSKLCPKYIKNVGNKGAAYIIHWDTDGTNIIGVGCTESKDNKLVKCLMKLNLKPGLFVVTQNVELLKKTLSVYNEYFVHETDMKFNANTFKLSDLIFNYDVNNTQATLVKIETSTFQKTCELFNRFKYDQKAYVYASVCEYWDPTKFVIFEYMLKKYNKDKVYCAPKVIFRWFTSNLDPLEPNDELLKNPSIPIITFDIETVSSEIQRIPTGEDINDILFSASIHHNHTSTLYTLVYIPVNTIKSGKFYKSNGDDIKNYLLQLDEYPKYEDILFHEIKVFTNEVDLLIATLDLINLPNTIHYLIGYNSIMYDMRYLLIRAQFYNLKDYTDMFIQRDGYSLGHHQFHLDLYRMCNMMYQLPNYKLSSVAQYLINESKIGVDAHDIRYTFFNMREKGLILNHEMSENEKFPSIRDILHYNNYDTLLVSRILKRAKIIDSLLNDEVISSGISLTSIMTYYDKMQYRSFNSVLNRGLSTGNFLCTFKSVKYNAILPVINTEVGKVEKNNYIIYNVDLSTQLTSDVYNSIESQVNEEKSLSAKSAIYQTSKAEKKSMKYLGGVNFCLGELEGENIQAYDYRIAYPLAIQLLNLSDETTLLVPANIVLLWLVCMSEKLLSELSAYEYKTHSGNNKSENRLCVYQYINYKIPCGATKFPLTQHELHSRKNQLIFLIWNGRRGVLSMIIETLNNEREEKKNEWRKLTQLSDELNDIKLQLLKTWNNAETNTSMDDDDDDDWGEDVEEEEVSDNDEVIPKKIQKLDNDSKNVKYSFVGDYIDSTLKVNVSALEMLENKTVIDKLIDEVQVEELKFENKYKLLKRLISSIYGCIGSVAPDLASVITCIIRSTLLASAQMLTLEKNCIVYYCDTDSMLISNPDNINYSNLLNNKFPYTDIEMKMMPHCWFVAPKTYYTIKDNALKYGQHTNGPNSWRKMINWFLNQKHLTTIKDIEQAFNDWFNIVYETSEQIEEYSKFVFIKDEYKHETDICVLKKYLSENYPDLNDIRKIEVYYHFNETNVEKVVLRPVLDLKKMNKLKCAKSINFYKFYNNVFMTVFNLIKFIIRRNNQPFNVVLNKRSINTLMLRSFLHIHESKFK